MNRIHILNTQIDNYSMSETLDTVLETIEQGRQIHHVVVNAGKIVAMQSDSKLRSSVNASDLINADGQAVVWASRFLGQPLKERVAGIDIMENLVSLAHSNGYRIFFFGARESVVSKVVDLYREQYGNDLVAGYRNGYFDPSEEAAIARDIASSGANILFVAISSPTKENFLYTYRQELRDVNFIMGVGGSFDVVSGLVRRAPRWMQRAGLEWFYRLIQEPRRMWKRYLVGNTRFILLVLRERFRWRSKRTA
ncbi:WecB/TagA/CpsF family glycosyltransferase [Robiginitalea sp. SC105]|uniref:WecB/TagA/CpsF family glycosyltransferase n=1 Tax=Robiginitalea sp. SC105 TaxID=2762332 RepID=UPI00163A8871|nr:WecB/TagA/CpsF family glycosyltransferase [Robiginitalea sp. SC105]MBC2838242.1 WecB/TagA/CpsF family glycosyltransferase [Robiginitalea sp. SC105]